MPMPSFFNGFSYRWIILGCCILAYAVSFLVRWSYTGLAPYIQDELHLDKAALGVLGGAFFYPYALAQIPWGWLTDRVGGRYVIACGVILSAIALACFATAINLWTAVLWRMVLGLVAATAFVPIASLLAQWFSTNERGLANGTYYGFGGGLGQGTAFLLMPLLMVYVLNDSTIPFTGWRGAFELIALCIGLVGVLCFLLLRSYPAESSRESLQCRQARTPMSVVQDPAWWFLGVFFSASLIALRLIPAWMSLYASDVFYLSEGYERDAAIVAGGVIGFLYTIGHIVGSPLLGKISDWLLQFEVERLLLPTTCLGVAALTVGIFVLMIPPPWLLGLASLLLGVVLHGFPVMNAVVSERWGIHVTGQSLGGINMVGQFAGALALSASGYIAMALTTEGSNALSEYQGIWYSVVGCGVVGGLSGWRACRLISGSSK